MTLNTFTFADHGAAQVAGHAFMGYMTGTYDQPAIEVYYDKVGGDYNRLAVEMKNKSYWLRGLSR